MEELLFYGYEFLTGFIPFLVLFLALKYSHKKKHLQLGRSYDVWIFFFALYMIGVYHVTGAGTFYDGLLYGLEFRQDQINYLLFSGEIAVIPYLLNIVMFLPLGFLVPLIWKQMANLVRILELGLGFSLFIEISQLLNIRSTDVDDLLMNTLGALLGYLLYRIWTKWTGEKTQVAQTPFVELPLYMAVVFAGRFFFFNEQGFAKLVYGF